MRLLIVGPLNGEIGTASRMAMQRGAKVAQVGDIDAALMRCARAKAPTF